VTERRREYARRWRDFSAAEAAEIRSRYYAGESMTAIARRCGSAREIIKGGVNPEWAARNRARAEANNKRRRAAVVSRAAEEAWRGRCPVAPDDTRSMTARLCGDPLPGRSALDNERHA
jgi:hypothetical protein